MNTRRDAAREACHLALTYRVLAEAIERRTDDAVARCTALLTPTLKDLIACLPEGNERSDAERELANLNNVSPEVLRARAERWEALAAEWGALDTFL